MPLILPVLRRGFISIAFNAIDAMRHAAYHFESIRNPGKKSGLGRSWATVYEFMIQKAAKSIWLQTITHTVMATFSHEYIAPQEGDSRSPCPALNALANHGYLPRDGKNLSFSQLVGPVRAIYGFSLPFAAGLAAGGIYICGHGTRLDLDELRKHNGIEHDGSMAHRDLDESGGPIPTNHPDPELIQEIVNLSDGKIITLENLVQFKAMRETRAHVASSREYPSFVLAQISHGEPIFILSAMGESDKGISVERFKTWIGEERLPEGYTPRHTTNLLAFGKKVYDMGNMLSSIHATEANERRVS